MLLFDHGWQAPAKKTKAQLKREADKAKELEKQQSETVSPASDGSS